MNGEESNVQRVIVDKNAFSNAKSLGGASGTGCRTFASCSNITSRGRNGLFGNTSTTGLLVVLVLGAIILYALTNPYGGYGTYPGYNAYQQPYGGGEPLGYSNESYGYYY